MRAGKPTAPPSSRIFTISACPLADAMCSAAESDRGTLVNMQASGGKWRRTAVAPDTHMHGAISRPHLLAHWFRDAPRTCFAPLVRFVDVHLRF